MAGDERIGLHTIKPPRGSRRPRKRVGRGEGSGTGKTAGRGEKGAGSRSGMKQRPRFEGGQNPIHMRMRKLRGLTVAQVLGLAEKTNDGAPEPARAEPLAAPEPEAPPPPPEETAEAPS